MNRDELTARLLRLLGAEGLRKAQVDLASLEHEGQLPDWLAQLVAAADALPLPEVPAVVSQDLRRLYESGRLLERHSAVLVRDTRVDRQLAMARGADVAEGWSMTYTSPVADVVLDLWPRSDETIELVGHVMGHAKTDSAYRATLSGPAEFKVSSDRLGRFRIESVPPGQYEIVIGDGDVEVTLHAEFETSGT